MKKRACASAPPSEANTTSDASRNRGFSSRSSSLSVTDILNFSGMNGLFPSAISPRGVWRMKRGGTVATVNVPEVWMPSLVSLFAPSAMATVLVARMLSQIIRIII